MGPVSSRGSVYSLSALAVAVKKLKSKIVSLSAVFLDDDPKNIVIDGGIITSRNRAGKRLSFQELAQKIYFRPGPRGLPTEMLFGNDFLPDVILTWFSPNTAQNRTNPYTTFCYSADFVAVEVDTETGTTKILSHLHVHDAGNVVSEELVEGQIHGGTVQGIGEALSEELIYRDDGVLLTNSLTDYVMPLATDSPNTEVDHMVTPSPYTELGTKGMAEASIISGKAVMISAIEDALSPFKIQVKEAPASSERIRRLILEAQKGNAGG
jgi:carbon-monoxide dehydrogenase large subunit